MDAERVDAYRTDVDLFVEAGSPEEASDALRALAGTEVSLDGRRVLVEQAYAVEGEPIDPASFESGGLPLYPGKGTIAVEASSLARAESILASLNGSSTLDDEGREVSFDLVDAPVEWTTMPAPDAPWTTIAISDSAHRFVRKHGGFVYVWGESFGGGFVSLTASTTPPPDLDLELHSEIEVDGRIVVVYVEERLATRLAIGLRRFPRPKLVVRHGYGD